MPHPFVTIPQSFRARGEPAPKSTSSPTVIRWRAAGLSAEQSSLLWALSVAAEVVMFIWIGPQLLGRLGPAGAMKPSALAGIVRWGTTAQTAWFPAMALVEPERRGAQAPVELPRREGDDGARHAHRDRRIHGLRGRSRTARFLKAEMKRAGVTYAELATRLKDHGLEETEASITSKLARGTFAATFLIASLAAIGCATVPIQEL